jgi:hypothetical protein
VADQGRWHQDPYREPYLPRDGHHRLFGEQNSGTLETARRIANHESPRTTKLYDRCQDEISLDEVERILI